MGVFHAAAHALVQREDEEARDAANSWHQRPQQGLPRDAWVRAVVKGADDRSPRWKHGIVFAGLLLGFGPEEEERLNSSTRGVLEQELVKSVNMGLGEIRLGESDLAGQCISLVLNHTFPLLPDIERAMVDYDALLPVLLGSAFFSHEGLEGAYFLAAIELDITRAPDNKLFWRVSPLLIFNGLMLTGLGKLPIISPYHSTSQSPFSRLLRSIISADRTYC
jgi:hypothetical protein